MSRFYSVFVNELHKSFYWRRILLIAGLITAALLLLTFVAMQDKIIGMGKSLASTKNDYIGFYIIGVFILAFVWVLALNFLVFTLVDVELSNNMPKYLSALPIAPWFFWLAKLLTGFLYSLLIWALSLLGLGVLTLLLPILLPEVDFSALSWDFGVALVFFSRLFVLSLAVVAFHLLLSYFVRKRAIMYLFNFFMPFLCLYEQLSFLPYSFLVRMVVETNHYKAEYRVLPSLWGSKEQLSVLIVLVLIGLVAYFYRKSAAQQ